MPIDLDLYRREVRVSIQPEVQLSVVDIAPDFATRTLLFLHGFGGNTMQWQYQLDHFAATFRVVAPDLRGHGLSDQPHSTYDLPELLGDIEAVLDTLGISGKIVLVGHSFGAALAAEFAITRPKRVEQVVLIAAATHYQINPLYRTLLKLPEKALDALAPLVRKQLWAPPFVLKAMHSRSVAPWDGPQRYPQISQPSLVIRGHNDRVFEKPQFEAVPRLVPQAQDIDVGASGHMVMLERNQATNRTMDRFLAEEKRAWSQMDKPVQDASRNELTQVRPWLPYYDENVPDTISLPRASLSDLLSATARRFPNKPAINLEGRKISYRSLNRQANRFANGLRQLGILPGDRVLLALPNLPQTVIAFYGVLKCGGVAVLELPDATAERLSTALRETEARCLVTEKSRLEIASSAIQSLSAEGIDLKIISVDPAEYLPFSQQILDRLRHRPGKVSGTVSKPPVDSLPFRVFLREKPAGNPPVDVQARSLAVIAYTSGPTGKPLGVMLSQRNLIANILQARHWLPEALEGGETILGAVPILHSYGMTIAMNLSIALGSCLLLATNTETGQLLRTIQRYQPTIFPGVPQYFLAINNYPEVRKFGVDSIRLCISGSAPLPVEVLETFEKLTHSTLIEGYGLTEAAPSTHMNPVSGAHKHGSIGLPLPSTEARLVDLRTGRKAVPPGQIGELAVRGPQVMMGYWKDPQATQKVLLPDGWLLTGDVGQMDSEGYFWIIARKADMWYPSRPGAPAFPRDIEEVLYEIPQVKEAVVVVVAGRPIAFIIGKQERPTTDAVLGYCKRRLPPDLVPRLVIFTDELPRSFLGRVLRRELASRVEAEAEAQPENPVSATSGTRES
jgi:long-chain acyl-CoA synthetase